VDLNAGAGIWVVGLVAGANINRLYRYLPAFVDQLRAANVTRLEVTPTWPHDAHGSTSRELGIAYINLADPSGGAEAVFFMPHAGGVVPTDGNVIADWIDAVLSDPDYADTTAKLLALKGDERHVFLMTGSRTPFGADERLRRLEEALPDRALSVPDGISHVWAVAQFGGTHAALWNTPDHWCAVLLPDPVGDPSQ
jgi:hypothetical protein